MDCCNTKAQMPHKLGAYHNISQVLGWSTLGYFILLHPHTFATKLKSTFFVIYEKKTTMTDYSKITPPPLSPFPLQRNQLHPVTAFNIALNKHTSALLAPEEKKIATDPEHRLYTHKLLLHALPSLWDLLSPNSYINTWILSSLHLRGETFYQTFIIGSMASLWTPMSVSWLVGWSFILKRQGSHTSIATIGVFAFFSVLLILFRKSAIKRCRKNYKVCLKSVLKFLWMKTWCS